MSEGATSLLAEQNEARFALASLMWSLGYTDSEVQERADPERAKQRRQAALTLAEMTEVREKGQLFKCLEKVCSSGFLPYLFRIQTSATFRRCGAILLRVDTGSCHPERPPSHFGNSSFSPSRASFISCILCPPALFPTGGFALNAHRRHKHSANLLSELTHRHSVTGSLRP